MKTLTKENFWNDLYKKYPDEVQVFCNWIDGYKERVKWNQLFNHGSPHYADMGWHNPKFHDLPIAMQFGIFLQFISEVGGSIEIDVQDINSFDELQIPEGIDEYFAVMKSDKKPHA